MSQKIRGGGGGGFSFLLLRFTARGRLQFFLQALLDFTAAPQRIILLRVKILDQVQVFLLQNKSPLMVMWRHYRGATPISQVLFQMTWIIHHLLLLSKELGFPAPDKLQQFFKSIGQKCALFYTWLRSGLMVSTVNTGCLYGRNTDIRSVNIIFGN